MHKTALFDGFEQKMNNKNETKRNERLKLFHQKEEMEVEVAKAITLAAASAVAKKRTAAKTTIKVTTPEANKTHNKIR